MLMPFNAYKVSQTFFFIFWSVKCMVSSLSFFQIQDPTVVFWESLLKNIIQGYFFIVFGLFVLGSIVTCLCLCGSYIEMMIGVTAGVNIKDVLQCPYCCLLSLKVVSASIYTFPSFAQPVLDAGKESSSTGRQNGRLAKYFHYWTSITLLHSSACVWMLCTWFEREDGRNCASTELSGIALLQPTMLHFLSFVLTWNRGIGKGLIVPEQASDMIQIWSKEHVHAVCTCVCYKIMVVGFKIELSWLDFLVN